jgi:hypothetical protein
MTVAMPVATTLRRAHMSLARCGGEHTLTAAALWTGRLGTVMTGFSQVSGDISACHPDRRGEPVLTDRLPLNRSDDDFHEPGVRDNGA